MILIIKPTSIVSRYYVNQNYVSTTILMRNVTCKAGDQIDLSCRIQAKFC